MTALAAEQIKVICKKGELFFPEVPASAGRIVAWAPVGQHCETDTRYYQTRTNPSDEEARALMSAYLRSYNGINGEFFELVRVRRQTIAMRSKAWERTAGK